MNIDNSDGRSAQQQGKIVRNILRKVYDLFSSVKLALALLVIILVSCVAGVTVLRAEQAGAIIFNTLWFNGILVMLVVNVAFCFFGRIWGRKITLVSFGMILFHLSFVAMLGGVIYNSLHYFRGTIRLTEGEKLQSGEPQSYDTFDHGRYFSFAKLKGETALIKMHRGYLLDDEDKRAAYEVEIGEGSQKKRGVIYITHSIDNNGFRYFNDREGYSLLIMLYNEKGKELYGGHVPLQSLKRKDETYLYTTGTKTGPGSLWFPQDPLTPLFELQVAYSPTPIEDRAGEAVFKIWPLGTTMTDHPQRLITEEKANVGERIKVGDRYLSATEVRYWVSIIVRYEPGKPMVLTSLWAGLGGMVLTFLGRMRRRSN